MLYLLFILVSLLLVAATLLPITRLRQWWVRGLDFPRVQITTGLVVCLAIYVVWDASSRPSMLVAFALVGSILWQLRWIWPYSEMHALQVLTANSREQADCPQIRVITSNVLMDNRDADRLLAFVHEEEPDILVTLETDAWWQEQLDTLDQYPHRIACPLDNRYGMHVYSRLPLLSPTIDFLVEDDIPSMSALIELPNGRRIRFHVVHPTPPAPGENPRSTERDVELLMLAQHLDGCNDPTIVTGDLNDVAWSATTELFRSRSGLLDPRVGRGMFNTFHAGHWYLRWPLDHTFVSEHFRVLAVRRLGHIGSDHFPVLFHLALSNPRKLDTHPEMEDEDHELERDTMETTVAREAGLQTLAAD